MFLAASSSLKGQSDKEKYEKARMLKVLSLKVFHNRELFCDEAGVEPCVFTFSATLSAGIY